MAASTSKTPTRKKARATTSAPHDSTPYAVHLRWRTGTQALAELALCVDDRSLYPSVQHWRYVVANRRRITQATRESLAAEVNSWLFGLGELKAAAFKEQV